MKTYREAVTYELAALTCDRCGTTAMSDDLPREEFVSIAFEGGYNSIFGDGSSVAIDLCQHCLRDTLGDWLRVNKEAGAPVVSE